jgi:glycosyltransferase involved in cell wall biosynthesis
MTRICLIPETTGVGGMVSFRGRMTAGLESRGCEITYDLLDTPYASVLVIGGTRKIPVLWWAKRRGIRIVQRLNGMNWLHRKLKTGVKHFLRAEYGNLVLRFIRSKIADHIVYQSKFAKDWWEQSHGLTTTPSSVVYNAVDLEKYSPDPGCRTTEYQKPEDRYRVLLVEGSLMGGYEIGLKTAVGMVKLLNSAYREEIGRPVELFVAGRVSTAVKRRWSKPGDIQLVWAGLIPSDQIPALDTSAHLLYSSDINTACPNSVIEALACGTPVLGFDTGAIPELVTGNSGRVVPYGGNPWNLGEPDVNALAKGAIEILSHQEMFRIEARSRAEAAFGLEKMVDGYLQALCQNGG